MVTFPSPVRVPPSVHDRTESYGSPIRAYRIAFDDPTSDPATAIVAVPSWLFVAVMVGVAGMAQASAVRFWTVGHS